jgi:copper homeostasis protein
MDTLIKLGVTRILTKGGKSSAINNIEHLKELKTYAADRIQLIVGGSVTDKNYLKIASETGIERFHGRKLAFNN